MKAQNQFPISPMSLLPKINSNLIKILTCFVVFGLGIAIGTIYSSNMKTVPFFSSQTIQASIQASKPITPLQNSQDIQSLQDVQKSQYVQEEFIKPEKSDSEQAEESQTTTFAEEEKSEEVQKEIEKPPNVQNEMVISQIPRNVQNEMVISQIPRNVHEEVIESQPQTMEKEAIIEPKRQEEQPERGERMMMHGMSDGELIRKALQVSRMEGDDSTSTNTLTPKVAFMFLARGELPFMPLWDNFFRGHQGKFSIYLHLSPDYNGREPKDSVFYGRRIPSKVVGWGKVNMMEAERRLLANALLDPANQRFVLLSESCVPLFNFPTIYSYLIDSKLSYIELYDDPGPTGRGRYKKPMNPPIEVGQWRKGSQWFEVDRFLAVEIISDTTYFHVFKRYCKGSCYTDEHYLPTLVNVKYADRNANRSLTWVDWSVKGAHPARYYRNFVTPEFLKELREGSKCVYNGEVTTTCYLFGRKFLPNSLIRFIHFSPSVMGFG